ncbi:MAG: DUF1570 domain-containing protein [Phycisphaerae bacterium]|nr:DUF1570 domain-containing protein [Phycisphaerae bacterium]
MPVLTAALILTACDTTPSKSGFELPDTSATSAARANVVLARDSWEFGSAKGEALTTKSFRIYSTANPGLTSRLPAFLEASLIHNRTALGDLPAPVDRMETFVLANRSEWLRCVQMIWAEKAEPYLTIQRGAVTAGGKSVLYDIGPRDTLVLAAHEGWHQFAQSTFKEQLPTWLDEAIAVYMEGFRSEAGTDRFVFLPWANTERFDRLREAHAAGALMSLREVMSSSPTRQISASGNGGDALTWYAQSWALIHWLNEGGTAAMHAGLRQVVSDASDGMILKRVEDKLGPKAAVFVRQKRPGPEIWQTYFGSDTDAANDSYQQFIARVVQTGSRDRIIAGRSPLE